jgi:anti-sigma regulatory factor (Ser/Thr protein kinase)
MHDVSDGAGSSGEVADAGDAVVRFPAVSTSPRAARRFVRDTLIDLGLSDLVESAELMVSELVTNAIVHGRSTCELTLRLHEGALRVEVRDFGGGEPMLLHPDAESSNGRGLHFVDSLSDSWGSATSARSTRVWFELAPV